MLNYLKRFTVGEMKNLVTPPFMTTELLFSQSVLHRFCKTVNWLKVAKSACAELLYLSVGLYGAGVS